MKLQFPARAQVGAQPLGACLLVIPLQRSKTSRRGGKRGCDVKGKRRPCWVSHSAHLPLPPRVEAGGWW